MQKDRLIFQNDNSEDWEPCPQYKAALGECPELVRVENCLCWTAIVDVLPMLPRVVHPVDVQRNEICVNGRDWHYLCGVIATENVFPGNGKKRPPSMKEGFHLKLLDRKLCLMYPEEKLVRRVYQFRVSAMAGCRRIVSRHSGGNEKWYHFHIWNILHRMDKRVSKILGGAYFTNFVLSTSR